MKREPMGSHAQALSTGNLWESCASNGGKNEKEKEASAHESTVYWPRVQRTGVTWMCCLVGRARKFGPSGGAEGNISGARAGRNFGCAAGERKRGIRGWLFLGGTGSFSACERSRPRDIGIRGRQRCKSVLRISVQRQHRARRISASDL